MGGSGNGEMVKLSHLKLVWVILVAAIPGLYVWGEMAYYPRPQGLLLAENVKRWVRKQEKQNERLEGAIDALRDLAEQLKIKNALEEDRRRRKFNERYPSRETREGDGG